ncbi:MAG: hypothetical protein F4218_08730 [Synechococcus sp. SB0677_bin_5]|nr:hypothetical protein [Synechococcus sp. SB0677_bin_5]
MIQVLQHNPLQRSHGLFSVSIRGEEAREASSFSSSTVVSGNPIHGSNKPPHRMVERLVAPWPRVSMLDWADCFTPHPSCTLV